MKGKDYCECFSCEHKKECEYSNPKCYYNKKFRKSDLEWRDNFHPQANLLDGFDYESVVIMLKNEKSSDRNLTVAKKLVKEMVEQRLEDMYYLLELNFDQIMNEVER